MINLLIIYSIFSYLVMLMGADKQTINGWFNIIIAPITFPLALGLYLKHTINK